MSDIHQGCRVANADHLNLYSSVLQSDPDDWHTGDAISQRHYGSAGVGTVLCSDGKLQWRPQSIMFLIFFPLPCLFTVRLPPGEGKLPPGVYPGCRDQQAEAHRPADGPLPSDLTSHG